MKQLFQKVNVLKVLAFFFAEPYKEFYLRDVARRLKMSPSTVMRCLAELGALGYLASRRAGTACYFKPILSPNFKLQKVAHTVAKIHNSGIIELVKNQSVGLNCFLLFGSAAKGEDDVSSDYDFVLIAASSKISVSVLAEKLGREVNLKKFTVSEWANVAKKNKAFYQEVLLHSVCLVGEKPVV